MTTACSYAEKIKTTKVNSALSIGTIVFVVGLGVISSAAHAMNLVVSEVDAKGAFYISWTDAKGGTGEADVVMEEKINGKYEVIYSYNNGPSANTYTVTDKQPGTYTYRITECVDGDCNEPIEKTVVVTAPKS